MASKFTTPDAVQSTPRATRKPRVKATVVEQTPAEKLAAAHAEFMESIDLPSSRRLIAASVVSLTVAAFDGYAVSYISGWVLTAAVSLTGSAFIAAVLAIATLIVGLLYSMRFASNAFKYVIEVDVAPARAFASRTWARVTSLVPSISFQGA